MNNALWIGPQPVMHLYEIGAIRDASNSVPRLQNQRTSRHGFRTIAAMLHGFVQICFALANITWRSGIDSDDMSSTMTSKIYT